MRIVNPEEMVIAQRHFVFFKRFTGHVIRPVFKMYIGIRPLGFAAHYLVHFCIDYSVYSIKANPCRNKRLNIPQEFLKGDIFPFRCSLLNGFFYGGYYTSQGIN